MARLVALIGTSAASAGILSWFWWAWGPRGAGFAFALVWSTMTVVAVSGKVIPLRLPASYHRIRSWEAGGRLYEGLGVRVAKALLRRGPMSVFNPQLHLPRERTACSLRRLDAAMRQAEASHLIASLPVLAWAGCAALAGWFDAAVWSVVFNVVVNGYPVMLQRYNRDRLAALIDEASGT